MTDVTEKAAGVSVMARGSRFTWLILSLVVVAADQFTKLQLTGALTLYQRVPVLPFVDFVRLHNTGAAFSFLAGASGWQNWLFMGVAVVVSAGVLWWLMRLPVRSKKLLALGLALLLGGAVGNLIDRVIYGYVIDFILVHYRDWSFPAFNVADSAISCGVVLVLFDGLILERRGARERD
jgi:signal peptidase II